MHGRMNVSLNAFFPLTDIMFKFSGAGLYAGLPHPVMIGAQSPGQVVAVSPGWQTPSPQSTAPGGASVALQCLLHVIAMLGGGPINVKPRSAHSAGVEKLPFLTTGSQQQPIVSCALEKSGMARRIAAMIVVIIIVLRILLPVMGFLASRTIRPGVCFCLLRILLCCKQNWVHLLEFHFLRLAGGALHT